MTTDTIISRVWSFCTTLRDDGVGYGDYLEQLTYLIFLKMADEYGRPPYKRDVGVPKKYAWATLRPLKGAELEVHYVETLRALGTESRAKPWATPHAAPPGFSSPSMITWSKTTNWTGPRKPSSRTAPSTATKSSQAPVACA